MFTMSGCNIRMSVNQRISEWGQQVGTLTLTVSTASGLPEDRERQQRWRRAMLSSCCPSLVIFSPLCLRCSVRVRDPPLESKEIRNFFVHIRLLKTPGIPGKEDNCVLTILQTPRQSWRILAIWLLGQGGDSSLAGEGLQLSALHHLGQSGVIVF